MKNLTIGGVGVTCPKDMKEQEAGEYVKYIKNKHSREQLKTLAIEITSDGCVDLRYAFREIPFERIRRIAGYLVGTTDRWNEAKKSELRDRTKHL